ncbi:MAG: hypothetical protein ACE5IC_02665 [Candidatus Brocadiales bacterium]
MYQEKFSPSPKDKSLDVGAAIDQVASHIPLKVFRKQGLSEVRAISEKTLNDLIEKAVEAELQKRFEAVSRERDELQMKSEALSRQLEELKEGSESLSGEKEELERNYKSLEEQVARLRSKAERTISGRATSAQTSITKEQYEEKIKEVVENTLDGARGLIPIDLLEKVKENLLSQLIEKFPHTTHTLGITSRSEAIPTSTPTPSKPATGLGPIKPGSLFHKLVENNIKWREKQKAQEKES